MSWMNYLYNEKANVAVEIGKKNDNDIDNEVVPDLKKVNDILCSERYTPEEKCGAVRVIFDESVTWDSLDFVISYMVINYKGWEVMSESDKKLDTANIIERF